MIFSFVSASNSYVNISGAPDENITAKYFKMLPPVFADHFVAF